MNGVAGTMMIWDNPLIMRGVRTRLRLPHALSWGLVTIVASTFLYIVVSSNAVKHGNASPSEAAREAIMPLMVMQGIILMVLGTGAVAGGMARERTYRLLDYQRLTPMTPTSKILGMLIGLPIREYFMFAISMPFVLYAAWVGGLSFGVLAPFYLVFLSSTLVYHMTGLVAGLAVNKPWRAGTFSQGLVIVLYFALPQFSHLGLTFFEHLTARPAFYGLVQEHLLPDSISGAIQAAIVNARYSSVSFFGMQVPPTVFSLLVQGYGLISLFVIVYRKWQGESRLAFSKGYALLFYAIAQLFLVGSVQPFLRNDTLFGALASGQQGPLAGARQAQQAAVFIVLLAVLGVSGVVAALVLDICTANWHQSVLGLRRAARRGQTRLPWSADAASSLPLAAAFMLMAWLGFIAIYQTAASADRLDVTNSPGEIALLLVFFGFVLITVQQVREQFSERVFIMALFVFWLVPFLAMIIIWSALGRPVLGNFVALPFPAAGFWFGTVLLVDDPAVYDQFNELYPPELAPFIQTILMVSLTVYGSSTVLLLVSARRRWIRVRAGAGQAVAIKPRERAIDTAVLTPAPVMVTND